MYTALMMSRQVEGGVPVELLCPCCGSLLAEAVMLPCCAASCCDKCARQRLSVGSQCPVCLQSGVSQEDLIPHRMSRQKVDRIRSQNAVPTPAPVSSPGLTTSAVVPPSTTSLSAARPLSPRGTSPPHPQCSPAATTLHASLPATAIPTLALPPRPPQAPAPPPHSPRVYLEPALDPLAQFQQYLHSLDRRRTADRSYRSPPTAYRASRSNQRYSYHSRDRDVRQEGRHRSERKKIRFVMDIPPETERERRERKVYEQKRNMYSSRETQYDINNIQTVAAATGGEAEDKNLKKESECGPTSDRSDTCQESRKVKHKEESKAEESQLSTQNSDSKTFVKNNQIIICSVKPQTCKWDKEDTLEAENPEIIEKQTEENIVEEGNIRKSYSSKLKRAFANMEDLDFEKVKKRRESISDHSSNESTTSIEKTKKNKKVKKKKKVKGKDSASKSVRDKTKYKRDKKKKRKIKPDPEISKQIKHILEESGIILSLDEDSTDDDNINHKKIKNKKLSKKLRKLIKSEDVSHLRTDLASLLKYYGEKKEKRRKKSKDSKELTITRKVEAGLKGQIKVSLNSNKNDEPVDLKDKEKDDRSEDRKTPKKKSARERLGDKPGRKEDSRHRKKRHFGHK